MQWMSEKLRHSGARLDSTSQSREMQGKQKELAKLLEPRKEHSCRPGTGRGLGSLQAASPRAAPPLRPVLPCRAAGPFVTRAIDGKAGAVAQVMSRSESLVFLWRLTRGEAVNTCIRPLTTRRVPGSIGIAAARGTKGADADAEEHGQDADGGAGS